MAGDNVKLPRSIGFSKREWDAVIDEARALSNELGFYVSAATIVRRCVRDKLGIELDVEARFAEP